MAKQPVLSLAGLSAGYFGTPVVRDLALTVQRGEVIALLGANGAGKTTTVNTIGGLLKPISGEVRLNGASVGGTPAHLLARKGVALVPENRALFPGLTTREHLRLAKSADGLSQQDLLELLPELTKCLDRRVGLLSGGEQQMLAMGRALMARPTLLIIDEMSMGLAPVIVERLLPVLRRAAEDLDTAVLLVEQHVSLALQVADRAYVLSHGRLVLSGHAASLREDRELLRKSYMGELDASDIPHSEQVNGHPPDIPTDQN
ncbi:ABC transporter ATP-binding protein [Angustibacter luteus]|uniref:ABC transporter ATP-binding protein n=1 Tax=Angustibacter luteus TaxID=658456 RepID=A0ABW1JFM3_9ACTN